MMDVNVRKNGQSQGEEQQTTQEPSRKLRVAWDFTARKSTNAVVNDAARFLIASREKEIGDI